MTDPTTPTTTTGPDAAPRITPPVAPKGVPPVAPQDHPPMAPKCDDPKTSSTTIDPSRPVLGGSVTLPPAAHDDSTKSGC